jgi:transposase-like protein
MDKAKTRQQLADEYGVNRKTLYRWLKRKKINFDGGLLTPTEQTMIYDTFGAPATKGQGHVVSMEWSDKRK